MLSLAPIERTIASERGAPAAGPRAGSSGCRPGRRGSPPARPRRWRRSRGRHSSRPPAARGPQPGGAEAARLALGQLAVAAHVAVLAARDQVERRLVAHVLDLAHRGGVHAGEPARAEHVLDVVVEGDPHAAAVHEVELLLLVVVVAAGGVSRRESRSRSRRTRSRPARAAPCGSPARRRARRRSPPRSRRPARPRGPRSRQPCGRSLRDPLGAAEAAARPERRDRHEHADHGERRQHLRRVTGEEAAPGLEHQRHRVHARLRSGPSP